MSAYICDPELFQQLAGYAVARDEFGPAVDPRYFRGPLAMAYQQAAEAYAAVWGGAVLSDNPEALAEAYANILYAENARSVLHRYPQDTLETAPGPIEKPRDIRVSGRELAASTGLTAGQVFKMADCLDYQSCETDDWEQTAAFDLLNRIRAAAMRRTPGYEEAEWGAQAA